MVNVRIAFPVYEVITYTGSDIADIITYVNNRFSVGYPDNYITYVSESNGVAIVDENVYDGNRFTINTGDIIVLNAYVMTIYTPVEFAKTLAYFSDAFTEASQASPGSFDPSNIIQAIGSASVPSLSAGEFTLIQMTISPQFSNTDYDVSVTLVGSNELREALAITNVEKVTGSGVDVTVENIGPNDVSGGFIVAIALAYVSS